MYYPLVGERVRVSGCRDEYIVTRADYAAQVAGVLAASATGQAREVPFQLLFPRRKFNPAHDGVASRAVVHEVLHSSTQCIRQANVCMLELREIVRATFATIHKSQVLIAESDRLIARWRTLDNGRSRPNHADQDAPAGPDGHFHSNGHFYSVEVDQPPGLGAPGTIEELKPLEAAIESTDAGGEELA